MNEHDQAILWSSEDPNWCTPRACFDRLHEEFDFAVDGAADSATSLCTYYLGPGSVFGEDALTVDLLSEQCYFDPKVYRIFVNPPFSRTLAAAYRSGKLKREGVEVAIPVDEAKARSYEIEAWAEWAWRWSQRGFTIVGVMPFAPQTEWYRRYVMGHDLDPRCSVSDCDCGVGRIWNGHAAREERRLPHRISFTRPDGSTAGNAGVNSAIITWKPSQGIVGPWVPWSCYWSYR